MFEFIEVVFSMIFLGYFFYFFSFLYCLIPMLIQIAFSSFIEGNQIRKIAIMILFTQGMIIPIAEMNHDMIYNIIHYSKRLGFQNVVMSKTFGFNIFYSLILFAITIVIVFFVYRSIEKKSNYKKLIALISGYLINIIIMVLGMLKFGKIIKLP